MHGKETGRRASARPCDDKGTWTSGATCARTRSFPSWTSLTVSATQPQGSEAVGSEALVRPDANSRPFAPARARRGKTYRDHLEPREGDPLGCQALRVDASVRGRRLLSGVGVLDKKEVYGREQLVGE